MDISTIPERRGTNCVKWDLVPEGVIPMWVADMDFEVAPCILEAVKARAAHPVYGYTAVPAAYYEAVCKWFATRHGWRPRAEWIVYTTGVVPAIAACLKAFTNPGDKVLMMSPIYNCFFSCIRNAGCELVDVPLVPEESADGLRYRIDFDALERAAATGVKVMLLCSPHNPACRVWTRKELKRVGEICLRHGIIPVSDEIHCEFVMPGHEYIPFASVCPEFESACVTLCSASKAFNIAGLQMACIITKDPDLRARVDKAINIYELCDVGPFGVLATIAAYSDEGWQWLQEVNSTLWRNYGLLRNALSEFPSVRLYSLEGTYLPWVDVSALCASTGMNSEELVKSLCDVDKVRLNPGTMYGAQGHLRINIACPPALFDEGLRRICTGLRRLGA